MESGDDGLESEANVRPRPCLTGAGSPGAQSTATDRGPSRQARLNRSAEGARTAYSARHTCPKTPETQSRNRSVRQAASRHILSIAFASHSHISAMRIHSFGSADDKASWRHLAAASRQVLRLV